MKTYRNGESSGEDFNGSVFGGVLLDFEAFGAVNDVTLDAADVDYSALNIRAILKREFGGQIIEHNIIEANGAPLLEASAFDTAQYVMATPAVSDSESYVIKRADSASVKFIGLKSIYVPFGGPVDCTDLKSKITVEVTVGNQMFSTDCDSSLSTLSVDLKEVEGVELFLPQIKVQVIPANEVSPEFNVVGLVKRVHFANLDKTNLLDASSVISSVTISTENGSINRDYNQLINERFKSNMSSADAELKGQSFDLIPFSPNKFYRQVRVRPILNTSNVNSSKNFYVAWVGIPSGSSIYMSKNQQIKNATIVSSALASAERNYKEVTE